MESEVKVNIWDLIKVIEHADRYTHWDPAIWKARKRLIEATNLTDRKAVKFLD